MKKGVILTVLLSAVAGAIAAFVVVKTAGPETVGQQVVMIFSISCAWISL